MEKPNYTEVYYYMLLSRLQLDCEVCINVYHSIKRLWGITIDNHIKTMKNLYNLVVNKPEWIDMQTINQYETELRKIEKG